MGYIRGARIGVAPEKPVPPGLPRAHMAGRRRKAHMIKRPNWHQHDWQPPQGRRKPTRPATLMELQLELLTMFTRIQHQVGLEKARRMFGDFAKEPTKTQRDYLEKCQWLERLDAMPWPNKAQLMKGEAARHERHPVNVAPDRHARCHPAKFVSSAEHFMQHHFALPLHAPDLQHLGI